MPTLQTHELTVFELSDAPEGLINLFQAESFQVLGASDRLVYVVQQQDAQFVDRCSCIDLCVYAWTR